MDYAYQSRHPLTQLAAMVTQTNATPVAEDPWFADSGANQHITANLEQLTLAQSYTGQEHVAVGNGQAHRDSTGLHLRQSKYIDDLLHRTKMIGAKPYPSPCSSGLKLSAHDGEPLSAAQIIEYRQPVGALQYCTLTHPDIAFSVNQLCQHMHCPRSTHWSAAKWVLRYLKGTIDNGLWYQKGSLTLQVYCDSDWAGNSDDRRSTTGYGVFFGSCLVSSTAKKQTVVAHSSTEAEYQA
ncbi:hypothetical protein F0562_001877 [Nyssa sinensis]|uniref:Reverse transcriptase Ty1/copia-type domain-containing protein n=1 Tax=Nyssa sinensis TaxID=561372 RepID=A0A5J5C477_9ASTE|nr:hypothetical protein F0562_001877 [Nyssa sinensis]